MIEETGQITALDGSWATVTIQRRGGCSSCSSKGGGCNSTAFQLFTPNLVQIIVHNSTQSCLGEQVVVGVNEGNLLQTIIFLYGLPLITMLIGMFSGQWLDYYTNLGIELTPLLGGLLGLGAGFGWVGYRSKIGLKTCQMVILRRYSG